MESKDKPDVKKTDLRERAEKILASNPELLRHVPADEILHLLHEQNVYEIELEMQNDELKNAHLELANSRDRYFDLYNFAPVGYVTIGPQGMVEDANVTLADMLGTEKIKLIDAPFTIFILEKDEDQYYFHRKELLRTQQPQIVTLRMKKSGGNFIWVSIRSKLAKLGEEMDEKSAAPRILSVVSDITREVQMEDQLRQAQKMEAVGQLAGGVAHDFNNVLQAILGYGEMAMGECETGSKIYGYVEQMLKAAARAHLLVRQLLAFSRRQVLEIKDVNLNEVVADVMKMLHRLLGEHIALDAHAGRDLGIVRADAGQIEQILMNLCVNARDAMPGGGTITITTENVRIDEAFCVAHLWVEPGQYVLLSVTDTGCGMDKETLSNIFEPFFTTKGVGEGTGLGLSMVYGLVKQHNGMVHVYSEVGKGSVFKIYLPLIERSVAAENDKIESPVVGGTETILLAEDEEMIRKLSKTILERAGYTVLTACDGEEALCVLKEHTDKIDLALLDVVMPKLGGYAVFKHIRAVRPEICVLFSSGYSMNVIHTNFIIDEGLPLIQKPCLRDDLLRRVREVLDA